MLQAALKSLMVAKKQPNLLPQSLIFFVTSRCNARCEFCLYFDQVNDPVPKSQELTPDEVDQIARNYGPLHYLALSGDEPFVRKDLDKICSSFAKHCGTSVIDIPSNFFYTENMVAFLESFLPQHPQTVVDLQLSIDHIGTKHDLSRKVKGLYEKAKESFQKLSEIRDKYSNLKIKINVVYLDSNKNELEQIFSDLSNDFDYDRVQLTFPNQIIKGDEDISSQVEEFIKAETETLKHSKVRKRYDLLTLGLRSAKLVYHDLLLQAAKGQTNTGSFCGAGKNIAVISEKGEIYPCEPLWSSIGNLRDWDYNMKKLLAGEANKEFSNQFIGPNKCNCTWGCAFTTEISTNYKHLPRILKSAARELTK